MVNRPSSVFVANNGRMELSSESVNVILDTTSNQALFINIGVENKTININYDFEADTIKLKGNENKLSSEDLGALRRLTTTVARELERDLKPALKEGSPLSQTVLSENDKSKYLAYKILAYFSKAPANSTIKDHEVKLERKNPNTLEKNQQNSTKRRNLADYRYEGCINDIPGGIIQPDLYTVSWKWYWGCSWKHIRNIEYNQKFAAWWTDRNGKWVVVDEECVGPDDSVNSCKDCLGRCGGSCSGSWIDNDYMAQCYNHDVCLAYHDSKKFLATYTANHDDCGDEWWAGAGSYLKSWGPQCINQWLCVGDRELCDYCTG
jgi:hypothetical protein